MEARPDVKSLYARVENLERQNRWMKRAAIAALVLVAAVAVMGQAQTNKVIEANGFRQHTRVGGKGAALAAALILVGLDGQRNSS